MYAEWMREAGFSSSRVERLVDPHSMVVATDCLPRDGLSETALEDLSGTLPRLRVGLLQRA